MDLDLALIEDAYHAESVAQQISQERDFAEGVIDTAQAVVMVVTLEGAIVRSNAYLDEMISGRSDPAAHGAASEIHEQPTQSNVFDLIPREQHDRVRAYLKEAAMELP